MSEYAPDALASFRRLVATSSVEPLAETSHHSLAGLYSPGEFRAEVARHREVCQRLPGTPGWVFRNTELITNDAIAAEVAAKVFRGLCVEGAERLFRSRSLCSLPLCGRARAVGAAARLPVERRHRAPFFQPHVGRLGQLGAALPVGCVQAAWCHHP